MSVSQSVFTFMLLSGYSKIRQQPDLLSDVINRNKDDWIAGQIRLASSLICTETSRRKLIGHQFKQDSLVAL